jgi:hypothetical protein
MWLSYLSVLNGALVASWVLLSQPMYCTVLCCTVLYCSALHCTALHCTALYCNPLWLAQGRRGCMRNAAQDVLPNHHTAQTAIGSGGHEHPPAVVRTFCLQGTRVRLVCPHWSCALRSGCTRSSCRVASQPSRLPDSLFTSRMTCNESNSQACIGIDCQPPRQDSQPSRQAVDLEKGCRHAIAKTPQQWQCYSGCERTCLPVQSPHPSPR